MTSSDIAAALAAISDAPQAAKHQGYSDLLKRIQSTTASSNQDTLVTNYTSFVDALLSDNVGLVATRPLLTNLIEMLSSPLSPDTIISIATHLLDELNNSTSTFEEQEALLRGQLATAYELSEDYELAAKTLQAIHLDTTQRAISDEYRLQMWIRITRLYLEVDETAHAESFLNRIKNLPSSNEILNSNPELRLHFQLSQARILDARHRFLDASTEYYNVSLSSAVAEDDRLQALSAAITAAVLAPAGPLRAKTLAKLYKDDRASATEEYSILEKMFLDRLLSSAEVQAFSAKLQPHQLAVTSDGSTVLTKAVIEHNLLAASKLYDNISTDSLADLLGLTASSPTSGADLTKGEKAEEYAARMVEQGRLKGVIDQIDGIIFFDHTPTIGTVGGNESGGTGKNKTKANGVKDGWDIGVAGLVEEVEKVAARVGEGFPELLSESMVH